jgi:hypothetical protein
MVHEVQCEAIRSDGKLRAVTLDERLITGTPPRPGLTTQQNMYLDLIELGLEPSIARERKHDPILIATHQQHHNS